MQVDVRDVGSIPGSGRSPWGGQCNPLQYSCLENPIERAAWQAAVYRSHRVGHDWSDLACMQWEVGVTHTSPLWWPRGVWMEGWGETQEEKDMCVCVCVCVCVCIHSWLTLLCSRNQHNTVKQLHSNEKIWNRHNEPVLLCYWRVSVS